jgi:hypothetical protein
MSLSSRKNIGAFLHAEFAAVSTTQTAGTTPAVTGVAIDRLASTYPVAGVAPASQDGGMGEPLSCSVLYAITATLANTHTMGLIYKIQDSVDAAFTAPRDFAVGSASPGTTVLTGISSGAAQNAIVKHDVDLNGAYRYVRVVFQATTSASSVDTLTVAPVVVFGGMAQLP